MTLRQRITTTEGLFAVVVSMVVLLVLPARYFVDATFGVTTVMLAAAFLTAVSPRPNLTSRSVFVGFSSAALLYALFYVGNTAMKLAGFPSASGPSGASIYSLISSTANPFAIQVSVLAFDAAGFEAFFRGTLQAKLSAKLGIAACPIVAVLDAAIHVVTLNPLWVTTTFVADLVWGLTYAVGRDLSSSLLSHFIWDVAIFVVRPIR